MTKPTVGQVEDEIERRIRRHPTYHTKPMIPRRLNCGWHLFHNSVGMTNQVLQGQHTWGVCVRCGRVFKSWMLMGIGDSYTERQIGYFHSKDPNAQLEEIYNGVRRDFS